MNKALVAALLAQALMVTPEMTAADRTIQLPPQGDDHWKIRPKKRVKSWKRAKKKAKRVTP